MDIRLAERIKKISPSPTLAITSKAKKLRSEGKDVINFAAGEPDFDTPDFIKEAAIKAIKDGFTKYTPSSGTPELKKLIAEKFGKENSLSYQPEQIIVSCGAKHSIFNALFVLVNPGDEVLIPSPYWVSYPEMVNLCQGEIRIVETSAKRNFKISVDELKKNITAKSKVLILNSPSNPCGCVYSEDELKAVAEICVKKNIFVISDEIYEKLIYDGFQHLSIASFNKDIYQRTITVNGVSKSYSMTGWRIGYLGAPKEISEAISKFQDHSTSNPNSIAQKAAEAALRAPADFSENIRQEFQKRRDYLVSRLKDTGKLDYINPQGAFYLFCDISKTGFGSLDFAQRLLEESLVSVIPGLVFGRDDYVRISFATGLKQLEKGMDRIEKWLRQ